MPPDLPYQWAGMIPTVARRLITLAATLILANFAIFALIHASGDPTAGFLAPGSSPEVTASMRDRLGLDRPLIVQAIDFIADGLVGNFGDSWKDRQPALQAVLNRLPSTLWLMTAALLYASTIGVAAGLIAVRLPAGPLRSGFRLLTLVGQAIPAFWLGTVLVIIFAVRFDLLPSSGNASPGAVILPAITLGTYPASVIARLIESGLRDARAQPFVVVARARGLAESTVTRRHVLPNAILPSLGYLGLQVSFLVGGAIVIESVFAWPGLGRFALQAATERDLPVVQATVTVVACLIFLANIVIDLMAAVVDPRLRPHPEAAHG
jgi:ABC-type dipeptide/oligopeptide/nickel transport system permease component